MSAFALADWGNGMRLFRTMMLVLCAAAGACQATVPVDDEKALFEQAWIHVREGESKKAIADFTRAIARV